MSSVTSQVRKCARLLFDHYQWNKEIPDQDSPTLLKALRASWGVFHYAPECGPPQRNQRKDCTYSLMLTIVVLPAEAINVFLTLVVLGQAELLPARLNSSTHNDQLILIKPSNDTLLRLGSAERGKL